MESARRYLSLYLFSFVFLPTTCRLTGDEEPEVEVQASPALLLKDSIVAEGLPPVPAAPSAVPDVAQMGNAAVAGQIEGIQAQLDAVRLSSRSKATAAGLFVPWCRALTFLRDAGAIRSSGFLEGMARKRGSELRERRTAHSSALAVGKKSKS